jgi:hypothetical protein
MRLDFDIILEFIMDVSPKILAVDGVEIKPENYQSKQYLYGEKERSDKWLRFNERDLENDLLRYHQELGTWREIPQGKIREDLVFQHHILKTALSYGWYPADAISRETYRHLHFQGMNPGIAEALALQRLGITPTSFYFDFYNLLADGIKIVNDSTLMAFDVRHIHPLASLKENYSLAQLIVDQKLKKVLNPKTITVENNGSVQTFSDVRVIPLLFPGNLARFVEGVLSHDEMESLISEQRLLNFNRRAMDLIALSLKDHEYAEIFRIIEEQWDILEDALLAERMAATPAVEIAIGDERTPAKATRKVQPGHGVHYSKQQRIQRPKFQPSTVSVDKGNNPEDELLDSRESEQAASHMPETSRHLRMLSSYLTNGSILDPKNKLAVQAFKISATQILKFFDQHRNAAIMEMSVARNLFNYFGLNQIHSESTRDMLLIDIEDYIPTLINKINDSLANVLPYDYFQDSPELLAYRKEGVKIRTIVDRLFSYDKSQMYDEVFSEFIRKLRKGTIEHRFVNRTTDEESIASEVFRLNIAMQLVAINLESKKLLETTAEPYIVEKLVNLDRLEPRDLIILKRVIDDSYDFIKKLNVKDKILKVEDIPFIQERLGLKVEYSEYLRSLMRLQELLVQPKVKKWVRNKEDLKSLVKTQS